MRSRVSGSCALACAFSLAFLGCGADTVSAPAPRAGASSVAEITQAELFQGALGRYIFSSSDAELRIRNSPYSTTIRLDQESTAPRSWSMISVAITGVDGIHHRILGPGAHVSTTSRSTGADNSLYVSALGCSGETRGAWNYDESADRVDLDVLRGATPDRYRMVVTAWFTYGGATQRVQASFEYDAR